MSELVYQMLMGAAFEKWFEKTFMDHVEGEEGAKSKEEILQDLDRMLGGNFVVALDFSDEELKDVLKGINKFYVDDNNPITVEELKSNPKLRAYLIEQLDNTSYEIAEGSYEAAANDWCSDINDYRGES